MENDDPNPLSWEYWHDLIDEELNDFIFDIWQAMAPPDPADTRFILHLRQHFTPAQLARMYKLASKEANNRKNQKGNGLKSSKSSWLDALRIWNKDKPKWTIPKKGSKGHTEIKKLMKQMKGAGYEKGKLKVGDNEYSDDNEVRDDFDKVFHYVQGRMEISLDEIHRLGYTLQSFTQYVVQLKNFKAITPAEWNSAQKLLVGMIKLFGR